MIIRRLFEEDDGVAAEFAKVAEFSEAGFDFFERDGATPHAIDVFGGDAAWIHGAGAGLGLDKGTEAGESVFMWHNSAGLFEDVGGGDGFVRAVFHLQDDGT